MIRLFFGLALAGCSVAAHALIETFDNGPAGWRTCNYDLMNGGVFNHFTDAAWSATGGNPGGALVTADVEDYCFLAAPQAFLGNQSSTFGTNLTYDTYSSQIDGSYPAVILTSGNVTLYNMTAGPSANWTSMSIPLVGSAWSMTATAGGAPVSDATLRSVLSNLSGLYILADWYGFAPTETTGLDNVRLQGVPEPATFAVLGLGVAALRRRRR